MFIAPKYFLIQSSIHIRTRRASASRYQYYILVPNDLNARARQRYAFSFRLDVFRTATMQDSDAKGRHLRILLQIRKLQAFERDLLYVHMQLTKFVVYLSRFQHSSILLSCFFGGDKHIVWLDTVRTYFFFNLVKIDVDSHNVRKSGQEYCSRGVWAGHVYLHSPFLKIFSGQRQ